MLSMRSEVVGPPVLLTEAGNAHYRIVHGMLDRGVDRLKEQLEYVARHRFSQADLEDLDRVIQDTLGVKRFLQDRESIHGLPETYQDA